MKTILVIGSLNIDFVVSVDEMPAKGETVLGKKLELIGGGKGANQACAAGKLGNRTIMLGALGNDMYADLLLDSLRAAHVDTSYIKRTPDVNTGIALITVDCHGENSITVIPGANAMVDRAYIDANRAVIEESDIVLFQLEIPLDTVLYGAKLCKELGKTVILDPAPAPENLPENLLCYVDVVKPNETELEHLTGIPTTEGNLKTAADNLRARGAGCVIVTLGSDGAYLNLPDGSEQRLYAKKVPVVDTTAAGDSFTAAVATKLAQGGDLAAAVKFANRVASVVVTRKGAQSSLPTMEEVEAFYR